MDRRRAALLVRAMLVMGAVTALVLGNSGCTAIGASIGRSIEESTFERMEIAGSSPGEDGTRLVSLSDSLVGRHVVLRPAEGGRYTRGRISAVLEGPPPRLVTSRKTRGLIPTLRALSDTVTVTAGDSLYVGDGPGMGMAIGIVAGVGVDWMILHWLNQDLNSIGLE